MYFYHNIDSLFTFHLMHRYVNIRNGIFSIESVKTTKKHEKFRPKFTASNDSFRVIHIPYLSFPVGLCEINGVRYIAVQIRGNGIGVITTYPLPLD